MSERGTEGEILRNREDIETDHTRNEAFTQRWLLIFLFAGILASLGGGAMAYLIFSGIGLPVWFDLLVTWGSHALLASVIAFVLYQSYNRAKYKREVEADNAAHISGVPKIELRD